MGKLKLVISKVKEAQPGTVANGATKAKHYWRVERCNGAYENVNGEFGKVIRRECIGCQRRMQPGVPMPVPEFEVGCPKRIGEQE